MAKILIIDDDKMVRDTLRMILTAAGHEIRLASDGKEGVQAFTELTPDLVITDILMPEKEGVETISDIRKLAATVPIIAVSGGGRIGNMSFLLIAEKVGANRTFTKPFEPDEMLDAVSELLAAASQPADRLAAGKQCGSILARGNAILRGVGLSMLGAKR